MKQEIQAPSLPERDKCRIYYSSEWTQSGVRLFSQGEKPHETQKELDSLFL